MYIYTADLVQTSHFIPSASLGLTFISLNRPRFQQLKNRQSSSAVGTSTGIVRLGLLVQTLLLELGVVGVTSADTGEVEACEETESGPIFAGIGSF